MKPRGGASHKILFNTAAPAISIWVSSKIFFSTGIQPYAVQPSPLQQLFVPLLLFTVLYFLLNSWLVAVALGFETNRSATEIWWKNFTWLSVNYFSGASVAALIVTYTREIDASTLAIIVPLLVVSYLTFRTAMGRVEDSNRHLSELNRLYLSTIETLAMAIDAKDQITHGHIRRVQAYAVGLAKHVGVTDEKLIKAIEAAALLHDMGKLAVPEYILNKPGKLTGAEFEKMKLHASVGADILTAIDFPYPVVPIVRHHHENWNGSGYPDGLKGTDIPIGARILSVVDCFDALTSDRPYRPRLGDDDAIRILFERRGTMYDPLIVDAFARVHAEIAPESLVPTLPKHVLNEITGSVHSRDLPPNPSRLDDISAGADEMLTLYELARALAGHTSVSDIGDAIAKHLRRLIPFALSVLFVYDDATDDLEAKYASGDGSVGAKGLRVPLGQRLSGWVAANRQTIVNSDPVLDLGETARALDPRLRSCLSTPLIYEDRLVGVLSLYSTVVDGFTEDHRRVLEIVGRQVSHTFKSPVEVDNTTRKDELAGLPSLKQLEFVVEGANRDATLLFVRILNLEEIRARSGQQSGDEVLRLVSRQLRGILRVTDLLFRCSDDEFVALLEGTSAETASSLARTVEQRLRDCTLTLSGGTMLSIDVLTAWTRAPQGSEGFDALIKSTRQDSASPRLSGNRSNIH
jgi:diguanylate cyclase (GGDEF)-like protein/putative nucleotidyltransferase with HDIG domain